MSESEKIEESNYVDPSAAFDDLREKAKAKRARERASQRAKDLSAIIDLENEMGIELKTLETQERYVEGVPVVVGVRPPTKMEYRRFQSEVRAAKENATKRGEASDLLAKACVVYPPKDSDAFKALTEAFPGTLNSVVLVATKLAELQSEDEKKG